MVTLKPDLTRQIEYLAGSNEVQKEAFVDKAVRQYIAQYRREKIRTETEAFEKLYEALLDSYLNQYVAIHNGQVIDHDPNLRVLHLRVFARLGHIPVLLKKVTREVSKELIFRSPRFERIRR